MKKTTSCKKHPCPIHRNWVDSSKALDDSTQFACYVSTWFARSHISQIYFRHDESTTGETIRVNSIESTRIDNIFNPPCITHRKSRSIKQRKITIHEPSSFLKRGHKPRSIPTIRVDWIEFSTHPQSPDQLYGIGFTNQFPVCRITNTKDESTLVGCIGKPAAYFIT